MSEHLLPAKMFICRYSSCVISCNKFFSRFLEFFPPGYKFVLEAVLIRAVHACCNAFVITSTFAFIVSEFPDHIAKVFVSFQLYFVLFIGLE